MRTVLIASLGSIALAFASVLIAAAQEDAVFTTDFAAERDALTATGKNAYFVLEPGVQLVLEDGDERLVITVLNETKKVDGVQTRIVEERETKGGALVEVSRNFFAISQRSGNVYYFGEEVDIYKDGKITSHEGAWLAGEKGAKFGLMIPAVPLLGARYHQEVAPEVAMDRAEIVGVAENARTAAGDFKNCLKIKESTPLEPGHIEHKLYAPGIGLIQDASLKLVKYGKIAPAN